MPSTTAQSAEGIVILGAGIIGCATAYYLTELSTTPASSIHLVDASPELFASASGKAAGFLASDWFGPATASLSALSFQLHQELAAKHDGRSRWGYSSSTGTSLATDGRLDGPRGDDWLRDGGSRAQLAAVHDFNSHSNGPSWLARRKGDKLEVISGDNTTAQVDPLRLSQFLLQESLARGVKLHQPARAIEVMKDDAGAISGVLIRDSTTNHSELVPCNRLIITAGAWTGRVFQELFPESKLDLRIGQLAGHSVVVESPRWTAQHKDGCHAVFTTLRSGFSPEIFSRVGGEIYVAGLNDDTLPLPEVATDAVPDDKSIAELTRVSQHLLGQDGTDVSDLKIVRRGICFRPLTAKGTPILSRIHPRHLGSAYHHGEQTGGVFVSAGHGPWGISQSLGTGKVMADLIENQSISADISRLQM